MKQDTLGSRRLFGTNGIRGVVNKELTTGMVIQIGCAVGTFFQRGSLILGYDARISSPMLAKAAIAGLTSTGCNVLFAGMAPTPALQLAVKQHKTDGAVIVTASHNPPEYNGIKVVWKDGVEISRQQETKIEDIFFDHKIRYAEWNKLGKIRKISGVTEDYTQAIKKHINIEKITEKQYHVVLDTANSVGSLSAPYLLAELDCKVTTINANIDGTFPGRLPEPVPENLGELARIVKAIGADLGVAYDGDADRSIFVDEKGEIHWGDKTFALVEKHFLQENPGEKVVTPVSSSTLIKDIADTYNGKIIWTKVGSVTVSQTMKKTHAKLGGEENGGIFYGPHQPVRDGTMATALIINIMTKTGRKLSKLIAELPQYFIRKAKVDCPNNLKDKVLKRLPKHTANADVSTIDGVKIWFADKSSILMRPSGTEPIYRLYAEAKEEKRAAQLIREYTATLERTVTSIKH